MVGFMLYGPGRDMHRPAVDAPPQGKVPAQPRQQHMHNEASLPKSAPTLPMSMSPGKPMKSVFAPTRVRVPLTDDYGEEVARYAARAEAGDIDAAMALANSTNVRGGTSRLYPPGIPDDRLHWLRIAAERGNLEAMCRYAIDVKTLRNWHPGEAIHRLDPKWLGEVEQNARRFLAIALSNEVPDAFPIAHSAHRDGLLGLPQDPAAAHACLLVFAQLFDDDIPRRLVEGHAARLKPAELHEAQRRAAAGAGCLIPG